MMTIVDRLLVRVRSLFAAQYALFSNASLMAAGILASSSLGFVYWWLAARAFPPEAVGLASASISILGLCALIGEFGLGTLLISEVARLGVRGRGLVSASLIAALATSALFGLLCVVLTGWLAPETPLAHSSLLVSSLFVLGTAVNGFVIVLDQVLIGQLRGSLQMTRNVMFAVLKLVMLGFVASLSLSSGQDAAIVATWVLGMLASIGVIAPRLGVADRATWHAPDWSMLRVRTRSVIDHHVLNIVTQAPGMILPFMVTVMISAQVNAAFFAAFMLLNMALLLPASVTTLLFTVGSADPASVPSRVRASLQVSVLFSVAASLGFYMLAHLMLSAFSPAYPALAGASLQILGFSVLGTVMKYHFIAVRRLQERMRSASLVLAIGGVLELAMSAVGAHAGGLIGLSWGLLLAVMLQGAVMIGPVLRAAMPDDAIRDVRVPLLRPRPPAVARSNGA